MRRGPKTPAEAALVLFSVVVYATVSSWTMPERKQLHPQQAVEQAPAPHGGETYHGVAVRHAPPRDGANMPAWVPLAVAGGGGVLVLGLGALGATMLLRRSEADAEADDPFADDPELRALVEAHERGRR